MKVEILLFKMLVLPSIIPQSFQTALHKASKEGYKEIVSVLLKYDADEKAEDMVS